MRKAMAWVGLTPLLLLLGSSCFGQTDPTPAPSHSLLVMGWCSVAYYPDENGVGIRFGDASGIPPGPGDILGCTEPGMLRMQEYVTPKEYRTFIHLIGPSEEYIVSCLGHISWHVWNAYFAVSKECVFSGPHRDVGRQGSTRTNDPSKNAIPAVPEVGSYITAAWSNDKRTLTIRLRRDYEDAHGTAFKFTVLRTMSSEVHLKSPSEIPAPYQCSNGEVDVNGARKCRPSE